MTKKTKGDGARAATALRKILDAQPIPTEGRMIWPPGADRPIMAKQPKPPTVQVIMDNKPGAHRLRLKIGGRFFVQTAEKDNDDPVTFDDEKSLKSAAKSVTKTLQQNAPEGTIPMTHSAGQPVSAT